jgi:hypothetical protein
MTLDNIRNYTSIPVSIITITQLSRYNLLQILLNCINDQTYENIIEWIIVEGSLNENDRYESSININKMISNIDSTKIKIKYLNVPFDVFDIKKLRDIATNEAIGDILVLMDDDDYYFPSYVHYCVSKLYISNKLLGCSESNYIYDFLLDKVYKFEEVRFLCYKKEFITNNTTNYESLISDHLYIKFLHTSNTIFDREKYFTLMLLNDSKIHNLSDNIIKYIIPDKYFKLYKEYFNTSTTIPNYDIVYLAGGFGIVWNPKDKGLGGSEQAIVHLSEEWSKLNKKVGVYGNFKEFYNINNVDYIPWTKFPFNKNIPLLISWRRYGILLLMLIDCKAKKIIVDLHDNVHTIADLNPDKMNTFFAKVTKFHLKSNYHLDCFVNFLKDKSINNIDNNKYKIIPNGVRKSLFALNSTNVIRSPYRFCYCSSYDRGLEVILKYIWPVIFKNNPLAEFHVYYGMDYIYDDNFKNYMKMLLSTNGVMDHGRQSVDIICREKYMSTFHLYLNNAESEIDCISIKESLITGCIPIISNYGVFKEREGVHINFEEHSIEYYENIANYIIDLMNDFDRVSKIHEQIKQSNTIIEWNLIAKQWIDNI